MCNAWEGHTASIEIFLLQGKNLPEKRGIWQQVWKMMGEGTAWTKNEVEHQTQKKKKKKKPQKKTTEHKKPKRPNKGEP